MSGSRRLGLPLEIHKAGAQPLVRGGKMLQQGGALPVEANALHDHAGQESENREIEITAGYKKSDLAAGHHRTTLAANIGYRGCT
jgi:hypothetical protein